MATIAMTGVKRIVLAGPALPPDITGRLTSLPVGAIKTVLQGLAVVRVGTAATDEQFAAGLEALGINKPQAAVPEIALADLCASDFLVQFVWIGTEMFWRVGQYSPA